MSDTQPIEGISPLPWQWLNAIGEIGVAPEKCVPITDADKRYIVLAANTYPAHLARIERLEAALQGVLKAWDRIGLCTECGGGGEGVVDSGGVTQWDQPINVPCGCSVFSEARAALAESEVADG